MKKLQRLSLCAFLILLINPVQAQDSGSGSLNQKNNIIKVNLTALPLHNYSFQYERILKKSLSVAVGIRLMPNSSLPFKNEILDEIDEGDTDTREVIEQFRMSNFAFTPELRWYVGKRGKGRGFYFAPFYRYANFKTDKLIFDYENLLLQENSITLSGKLSAHTGGIMLGAQWFIGKSVSLDWWILGPHYGGASGTFIGNATQPLTPAEQNDLRQELEDLDIPFTRKTVTVTANTATLKLDGPWAGLRAGICFGIRL